MTAYDSNSNGTWGYVAGVSGTVTLTQGKRLLSLMAHASGAPGSVTLNGGDTIVIPADNQVSISFIEGKVENPVIVFTGTDSYYVDWII